MEQEHFIHEIVYFHFNFFCSFIYFSRIFRFLITIHEIKISNNKKKSKFVKNISFLLFKKNSFLYNFFFVLLRWGKSLFVLQTFLFFFFFSMKKNFQPPFWNTFICVRLRYTIISKCIVFDDIRRCVYAQTASLTCKYTN